MRKNSGLNLCLAIIILISLLCGCVSTSSEGTENKKNQENSKFLKGKKNPEVYVKMDFDFGNIKESEAIWLVPALSEKLKTNLLKYTDYGFIESDSENIAQYSLLTTIRKTERGYSLLADFIDSKTGETKATAESSSKNTVSKLFLGAGNATDEITVSLCNELGFKISELEQNYIIKGEEGMSLEEKQDLFEKIIKDYKYSVSELEGELNYISSSTDSEESDELKRVEAEKIRAEDKLKLAEENKRINEVEITRHKAYELKDAKRSGKKKEKFNSIAQKQSENIQDVRKVITEAQPLIDYLQIIELKKKAVVDIHNIILTERQNIYDKTLKNILDKRNQIRENPFPPEELEEDGKTPLENAVKQRENLYIETKNSLISEGQKELDNATEKLFLYKNTLLSEINKEYSRLESRKISTLGNNLAVTHGDFNKDKQGWDLIVTVKNNDAVIFQTTSFLSLGVFVGKDPKEYFLDDYIGYRDDLDFYENLMFGDEPPLIYELEYTATLEDGENPSQYNLNFYNFKCYDTESLTVIGNNLSSSKINDLQLGEENIIRQMLPASDLTPVLEELPSLKSLLEAELEIIENREVIENSFVKILPFGTSGSYGTRGTYVEFGSWPQTVKAADIIIDDSKVEIKNGWECYNGSDGFYYVKVTAEPQENNNTFSNGELIKKGTDYYFKIEPIKWRVVTDDYQGGNLLVAENILAARCFAQYYNNYKNSEIRSWLNHDFINSAFTEDARASINIVTLDNGEKSTGYSNNIYACENTEDKIFLLSAEEIINNNYGFSSNDEGYDKSRRRETTDYARAVGAFSNIYKTNCYWLRSPYNEGMYTVRFVDNEGTVIRNDNITSYRQGIVPALTVNF